MISSFSINSGLEERIHEDDFCPDSDDGEHQYINSNGYSVCEYCGLTNDQVIETGERSSVRAFNAQQKEARSHREILSNQTIGARTQLGSKDECLNYQIKHLRKVNNFLIDSDERNYSIAQEHFSRIRHFFPEYIIDDAWLIYKQCKDEELLAGRSIETFVAAATYTAIKINKKPLLLDDYLTEISTGLIINRKEFYHTLRVMNRELGIDEGIQELKDFIQPYFEKVLTKLLPEDMEGKDEKICEMIKGARLLSKYMNIQGKTLSGVLAGLIYERSKRFDLGLSQKKIARELKTTEVTLRGAVKEVKRVYNQLIKKSSTHK